MECVKDSICIYSGDEPNINIWLQSKVQSFY